MRSSKTQHESHELARARKQTFGLGLLKGLGVTLKHLFKHNTVIQYPDEKQDLPARTRGVIALKEENCTVCMLCGRECPDWCIYIDSHKETLPPKREGGRPRKRNVLDRFAIDYALCMYCGICVEVCPYDALFWSREFEYAEYDIRELTHEKERLSDWMSTVLPPPELEVGAEVPNLPSAAPTPTVEATGARPPTTTSSAVETRAEQVKVAPTAGTAAPTDARPTESLPETEQKAETETVESPAPADMAPETFERGEPTTESQEPSAAGDTTSQAPTVAPTKKETKPPVPTEDPQVVYERVLAEQLEKGSSPQVAEARAKVARVKAERGVKSQPASTPAPAPVPSAPTEGRPTEPEPSGAPEAEGIAPEPGPVAPEAEASTETTSEPEAAAAESSPAAETEAPSEPDAAPAAEASGEDGDAAYRRVLQEERDKGSSEAVAMARAKAARVRAQKGTKGPGA
jgi:formate hydrogenlyase subunit 6/NADH:ubiquinone oxidoreductase subunit I